MFVTIFSTIRLDCLAQAAASNVQKEIDEAVLAHLKRCFSFLRQKVLPERRRTYRYISLLNSRRTEVSIYLLYPISVRVPCRKRSGGGPGGTRVSIVQVQKGAEDQPWPSKLGSRLLQAGVPFDMHLPRSLVRYLLEVKIVSAKNVPANDKQQFVAWRECAFD